MQVSKSTWGFPRGTILSANSTGINRGGQRIRRNYRHKNLPVTWPQGLRCRRSLNQNTKAVLSKKREGSRSSPSGPPLRDKNTADDEPARQMSSEKKTTQPEGWVVFLSPTSCDGFTESLADDSLSGSATGADSPSEIQTRRRLPGTEAPRMLPLPHRLRRTRQRRLTPQAVTGETRQPRGLSGKIRVERLTVPANAPPLRHRTPRAAPWPTYQTT